MFNFLNGLFLAGIAAAAIPVIIHLLNRRRLKRIEFSDLQTSQSSLEEIFVGLVHQGRA